MTPADTASPPAARTPPSGPKSFFFVTSSLLPGRSRFGRGLIRFDEGGDPGPRLGRSEPELRPGQDDVGLENGRFDEARDVDRGRCRRLPDFDEALRPADEDRRRLDLGPGGAETRARSAAAR